MSNAVLSPTVESGKVMAEFRETLDRQGVFFGSAPVKGKTVFLFPGHGSQYPNMMQGLVAVYPVVEETFRKADGMYRELTGKPLTALIFGSPNQCELNLKQPEVMQPALYTTAMAMYHLAVSLGLEAEMMLGHSLGEFAALASAEVMTFEEGFRAVCSRAESLRQIPADRRGAMISIQAGKDTEKVLKVLAQAQGYFTRSIVNSSDQWVISGETEAVALIDSLCREEGVKAVRLPVTHAFHSALLAPAVSVLQESLRFVKPKTPRCRVLSTVLGDFYDAESLKELPAVLSRQLTDPFDFSMLVRKSYDAGARVFIELGPKSILTNLTRKILGSEDSALFMNSNSSKGGDLAAFARLEAFCRVHGLLSGDRVLV